MKLRRLIGVAPTEGNTLAHHGTITARCGYQQKGLMSAAHPRNVCFASNTGLGLGSTQQFRQVGDIRRDPSVFPRNHGAARPVRLASNKIAEFGEYDSLVGLGMSLFRGETSYFPAPNGCRPEKMAPAWETKAKPSVIAQAPAALLSLHNAAIRFCDNGHQIAVFRHKPVQGLRNSSGSLAMFAAIRRALSRVSNFAVRLCLR